MLRVGAFFVFRFPIKYLNSLFLTSTTTTSPFPFSPTTFFFISFFFYYYFFSFSLCLSAAVTLWGLGLEGEKKKSGIPEHQFLSKAIINRFFRFLL